MRHRRTGFGITAVARHDGAVNPGRVLTPAARAFLAGARRAILATVAPDGRPRLVPVCFALAPDDDARGRPILYTPLDEKPKRVGDPHQLARVRDLLVRPDVTLLVDRWDEDWQHLAWLRLDGTAALVEPDASQHHEHAAAVAALRAKYPQYARQDLEGRPLIRVVVARTRAWQAHEERPSSDE